MVNKPSTAVTRADKSLEEVERENKPAEQLTAHHPCADSQAWMADTSEPRPEDFAKAERTIEKLDACRTSAGREMPAGEKSATPTINLIPSDPTRVMVTKTTAAAVGRTEAPKPSAFDLSNLVEDFVGVDEQNRPNNQVRDLAASDAAESEHRVKLENGRGAKTLPIEILHSNRLQPRLRFDEEGIRALADSLTASG